MKLSIIIPAYNEEKTIENLIIKVEEAPLPNDIEKELIIINDASKDGTKNILEKININNRFKLINHKINEGKGASVIDGLKASSGEFVIIQDADLEYDPNEYRSLLQPILEGDADVVYGSRFSGSGSHRVLYFWHSLGNKVLTTFSNMMTNLNLTDMETCYKMMTRKVVDKIKNELISKRFGIEPEITARVKKFKIYETGISYKGRTYAEGKKIGWKDGISALWAIVRFNIF